MPTSLRWTPVGFPEDKDTRKDPIPSAYCEEILTYLRAALYTSSVHAAARIVAQYESDLFPFIPSPQQTIRLLYFMGRAYLLLERWNDALAAFAHCHILMVDADLIATIHLHRWWSHAAHQAHQYEYALGKYQQLYEATQQMLGPGKKLFILEDPYGFLCSIYHNLALVWLHLCAFGMARNFLEWNALPLIRAHFHGTQPLFQEPARDRNAMNWRLLHLFILWMLSTVISWQVQLASDPSYYEQDITDAYENIRDLAEASKVSDEGHNWTSDLDASATELLVMRCGLTRNRQAQGLLCGLARQHWQLAQQFRRPLGAGLGDRLRGLLLDFPLYELEFREHEAAGTLTEIGPLMAQLTALHQSLDNETDPSYRFFAVRCSLLLGTMAYARHRIARKGDATWRTLALNHFNQALDILDRGTALSTLLERAIRVMRRRLLYEFPL